MPVFRMSTENTYWLIVAAVLAVVGGLVLYFVFLNKKNEGKYKNKFLNWMYDFLNFKKMFIEELLKITYLILAIFITLASLGMGSPLSILCTLVLGNVFVRVAYEFSLVLLVICRNTTEINNKMPAKREDKKAKKEEE